MHDVCTFDCSYKPILQCTCTIPRPEVLRTQRSLLCLGIYAPVHLLRLFEWISNRVVFPQHDLLLLFRRNMLDPDLLCHVFCKRPNEPGVPKFRGNAEILAAAHKGVGFAALGGGGNAVGVEVLLFAAGDGN